MKGDNYKELENGTIEYELGCDLFVETNKEMPFVFKEAPDWWLVELGDILKPIEPPNLIERRTRKRYVFAPRDLKL